MDTPPPERWLAALVAAGYTVGDGATTGGRTAGGRPLVVVHGDRRATVAVVALADDDARAACAEHLARWRSVDDPAIDRLDDALDLGDAVALVRPCSGVTLAEFVRQQGRLVAGQASTLVVVLGRALARLHADCLFYGAMSADDVLVVDGQPRLVVPGPPGHRGHVLPPSPAEDAYHLAALTSSVIAPAYGTEAGARSVAALRALDRIVVSALGDAQTRPGVGTLAALSHDIAACQPLVVLEPPPTVLEDAVVRRSRGRRRSAGQRGSAGPRGAPGPRRPSRRPAVTLVGGVVGVLVGAVWWAGASAGLLPGSAAPTPVPVQPEAAEGEVPRVDGPEDGAAVAAAVLTEDRFDLLAAMTGTDPDVDARAWADVTVVGSPAHTQALELVSVLVAGGSSVSGLSATVESATLLEDGAETARVEVVYSTSEYAVRSAVGSTVVPAADGQTATLTLVRTDVGWRVSEVGEAQVGGASGATAVASTTPPQRPTTGG